MSIARVGIPATRAASRSKASATWARHVATRIRAATMSTAALTHMREGVMSRRRPNMRDSSCPDMSPILREMTIPREKNAVRMTAVVASEDFVRREATVSAAATQAAHRAPPGMMASRPPTAMPTTIPGNTPCTMVSALNSALRRLTRVEAGPTARARRPRTTIGRSRYGTIMTEPRSLRLLRSRRRLTGPMDPGPRRRGRGRPGATRGRRRESTRRARGTGRGWRR